MFGYIYKITNRINGKIYIGQHKAIKFEPEAYTGSGKLLLQAYDKYGKENFDHELLCECYNQFELDQKEIFYINLFESTDLNIGYNIAPGGFGGSGPQSDDTRQKIREATTGLVFLNNGVKTIRVTPEEVSMYEAEGFVPGMLPFSRSETFKKRLSESTTGKKGMHRITSTGELETCWGYPDEFEQLLSEGWAFGWKPKVVKEKVEPERKKHMFKDGIYKLVPVSEVGDHLENGWIFQCFTKGKSPWNKDKEMNQEYCHKLSLAHTGEKHTRERVKKHADQLRGRTYMHKDGVNKLIPVGEELTYELAGWVYGRVSKDNKQDAS